MLDGELVPAYNNIIIYVWKNTEAYYINIMLQDKYLFKKKMVLIKHTLTADQ